MHPRLAQAIQQVDAAVFNGDTFENPDDRAELLGYIERWVKELPTVERRAEAAHQAHEGAPDDVGDAVEWDDGD